MRNPWGIGAVLGVALIAATSGSAAAQASPPFDSAIDVQTFEYAIGPKTFFTVSNADVADKGQLAIDAVLTYLTKPFSIYEVDPNMPDVVGDEKTVVVRSVAAMQITGAYGVSDKLQIGANLPLIFQLTGEGLDPMTGNGDPNGLGVTGLGDLLVEGKYRLYRSRSLKVGGIVGLTLPTSFGSDGSQFIGDDLPTGRARVAMQYDAGKLSVGMNGGILLRKPRTIYDSTIGQQLTWGVAAAIRITDRFSIIGESYGRAGLPDFSLDASPLEAEAGLRIYVRPSVAVVLGGGAGLVRGIGSPQSRFFISLGYAPDVRDSDGDGIPNVRDKCPLVPEDFDGHQDEDGCPDDDSDGDLRPDDVDKCPLEPEDLDGFEDEDGCPDLDNDGDGILDADDKCPNHAEDGKAPHPNDGCPASMRDSDGDGVYDDKDQCPLAEEDMDGFEDEDGCPDLDNDGDGVPDVSDKCPLCPGVAPDGCHRWDASQVTGVRLDGDRLVVDKMPALDRNGLNKASLATVDQMALVILANHTVTKWLIALALPKAPDAIKLADTVKARLIAQGVPEAYLQVLGAAGPARIGGVVQERGDDALPVCPAGREVRPRGAGPVPVAAIAPTPTPSEPEIEMDPPDRDGDGIPDAVDKCPDEPETKNSYQDEDGCPDTIPSALKQFSGTIKGINFASGSAKILPASFKVLDGAAKAFNEFPDLKVEIQGHTDDVPPGKRGAFPDNIALSSARADAVRDYLVGKGVDVGRLSAKGYGAEIPLTNPEKLKGAKLKNARTKNRRVEFKLLGS